MNDVFNEQLVKRQSSNKELLYKVGIIVGAIVLFLILINIPYVRSLGLFIILGECVIVVYLFRKFNLEYEYILTNNELDIDKIINMAKRKNVESIDVKSFEIIARVNDKTYANELNRYDKLLDVSSGEIKDNTYGVIYIKDGKRIKLIFEPNEHICKGIQMYCASKFKK